MCSMAEAMQEMQMLGAMGLLPEEMYASVNQMSRIMSPASAPSAFSDPLITSFVEGVVQGIVKAIGDGKIMMAVRLCVGSFVLR